MLVGAKVNLNEGRWEMLQKIVRTMDFLEIYFTENHMSASKLRTLKTKWGMHAPHVSHGVNLINPTKDAVEMFKSAVDLGEDLDSEYVVIHLGFYLDSDDRKKVVKSAIKNMNNLAKYVRKSGQEPLIENLFRENQTYMAKKFVDKPTNGLPATTDELDYVLKKTGCGFCLDFSHAVLSANSQKIDYKKFISSLLKFNPKLFHLCDGKMNDIGIDRQLSLGEGDFPLKDFVSIIGGSKVVLEINPVMYENYVDGKNLLLEFQGT